MTDERIKEIQQETAYPDSLSVQQALLKVWNELEHEKTKPRKEETPNKQASRIGLPPIGHI